MSMRIFKKTEITLKTKVIVFFAIVFITGLPLWVTSYAQYSNHNIILVLSILSSAACACIMAYKTTYRKSTIILYIAGAQQIGFLLKVCKDCNEDPTNHNLFPFEMVLLFGLTCAAGCIATLAGKDLQTNK